ncbi:hypothetical protein F4808DRAFT_468076 [Astrocystis sublimbata]|nr:hypothetical protein F4808DRAFT_468076 [Astrocystis sublimbata]
MSQSTDDAIRLPFRQTCNRCRQLKVRCKALASDSGLDTESAAESRYPGGLACSRCVRAGAICTYSSKQRSGRPRVDKSQRRSSPSSVAMLAVLTPPSTANDTPEPFSWTSTSQDGISPSLQLFEANDVEMAQFLNVDEHQCLGADGTSSTLSDNEKLLYHDAEFSNQIFDETIPGLMSECAEPVQALPDAKLPKTGLDIEDIDDLVIKDTVELTELNKRIYRLQLRSQASEFPMAGLCDDMTSATHSLVEIMARLLQRPSAHTTHLRHQQDQVAAKPTISSTLDAPTTHTNKDNADHKLFRQTIRMSLYPDDDNDDIDFSTVLLMLACYQRLCDLFKQTSLSIHVYIQTNGTSLPCRGQMVMTAELMTYLIGRLDRVLSQVTTRRGEAMAASGARAFRPFHRTMDSYDFDSLLSGGRLRNGCNPRIRDGNGIQTPDISDEGFPATCPQGLSLIVHEMHQFRMALQGHITMIKQAVRESDII